MGAGNPLTAGPSKGHAYLTNLHLLATALLTSL